MGTPAIQRFKKYSIKCKTNWFKQDKGTATPVKIFKYMLSQYTPSIYALVTIIIDSADYNEFLTIENKQIQDRLIEVYFEDELYMLNMKKSYFSGPYKFCVVDYNVQAMPLTQVDAEDKKLTDAKMITMHCIDQIFYKMTLNETFGAYGKILISDVVKKIILKNGGLVKKSITTDYAYPWLQCQLNDYQFIRSMLPYAKSSNGDLCYTFFMLNNYGYFAPISNGISYPVVVSVDNIRNVATSVDNQSVKTLIEKFGNIDNLYCAGHGYDSFKSQKPDKMRKQSFSSDDKGMKQHKAIGTKYLYTDVEDETLQKNYVSNYRHRIYTFSKVLSLTMPAIPDILPIHYIKIVNDRKGTKQPYNGLYYVLSVHYTYYETPTRPEEPTMQLLLSSEMENKGTDNAEGSTAS
jgi:hypothetical protein